MVPEEYVRKAESIIGHTFVVKQYIHDALTAAGAEEENYEGNRKLSQVGDSLIDAILASIIYGTNATRASSTSLRQNFKKKENYEAAARQTGIDQCIYYNKRTETRSSKVLRKALNAIIAAVFLDTCWDLKFTIHVILEIFTHRNIQNHLLSAPSISTPDTSPLSEGVDLFLHQWIGKFRCKRMIDGNLTGEYLSNASDPYLSFEAQLPFLPVFASPFMGPSFGVTGWTSTELVPTGDNWLISPEIQHNFETGDFFDGLFEITPPGQVTHSINQQYMALETNAESFQQDSINYVTPGSGFCGAILNTDINMPPSSSPNNCLQRSNRDLSNPKKRKRATEDSSSRPKGDLLQNYLSQERQKCDRLGMLPPEETYFNPMVQDTICDLGNKHCEALLTIFVTIASPRSILALRDMICTVRKDRSTQSYLLGNNISHQRRFHMIQELDQNISFMQLMKWLHVLELFQDCGGPGAQSFTGYIVDTPDSFGNKTKTPGNQRNREDNQVALSMLSEVFPDLKPTDETHHQILSTFKVLRRLGKRLHTLSSKFGKGVFGLMLDYVPDNGNKAKLNKILLDLNDSTFSTIVSLLESSQGNILREFSAASSPLLNSITNSTVHPEQQYKLEKASDQDILSQPKGSDALLHLIS